MYVLLRHLLPFPSRRALFRVTLLLRQVGRTLVIVDLMHVSSLRVHQVFPCGRGGCSDNYRGASPRLSARAHNSLFLSLRVSQG